MELIDISRMVGGVYSSRWHEIISWLNECIGPQAFKGTPKQGVQKLALVSGSNWRIYPVSYALHRARPGQIIPGAAIMLELDDDASALMFKLRWL
jgi:hypothetical protein